MKIFFIHILSKLISVVEGFREKLSSKVTTIAEGKKNKKSAIKEIFNPDITYSRVTHFLELT